MEDLKHRKLQTQTALSRKDYKYVSHGHSSSKLTSRYESRKHGTDGRVVEKAGGLGSSLRKYPKPDKNESSLLAPSYMYEENRSRSHTASHEYEEAYKDAKSQEQRHPDVQTQDPKIQPKVTPVVQEEKPKECKADRYTELNPLMTKMVEDELKNIMINVWQTLPDNASSEADKLVVDKFKDTAGDDLRNTIGLNVTMRLLNVHRKILVMVKLTSPVASADIYEFAKKYGISDLKYVETRKYAGRMHSWTELDQLYSVKNLRCGKSHVTVSPIYDFIRVPSSLRTVFDGKKDYSNAKELEKEVARKMEKPEAKAIVTADMVLAEEAKKATLKKDNVTKEKVQDTMPKDVNVEKTESAMKIETKAKNVGAAPKTVASKTVTKQSEATNIGNKEIVKPKPTGNKSEPVNKPVQANVVSKETKTEITKVQQTKPSATTSKKEPPPKKEIVTSKSIEDQKPEVKAVNVTPSKTPVKEPTKAIANKPSDKNNTTNKEVVKSQPGEAKQLNVNAAKLLEKPPKVVAKETVEIISKEVATVVSKVPAKVVSNQHAKVVSKEQPKVVLKEPTVQKQPGKIASQEPTKVVSKQPNKTAAIKPAATNTPKKEIIKPKPTLTKKPQQVVTSKKAVKETIKSPVKGAKKNNVNTKAPKKDDDFDELSDRDILALLSSGIVLDECSGSDED